MHGGGCVCRSVWLHTGVCLRAYSRLFSLCSFSLRLPEPRANPMDPRDFEDDDFGPSMDHAPWYQQIRLFTHPLVLQCLLQPAVNSVPCTPPRHSCCLLAVNWPRGRLLWQIWMATSFLLQKCLNYSLLTDFLYLGQASYMQSITIRLNFCSWSDPRFTGEPGQLGGRHDKAANQCACSAQQISRLGKFCNIMCFMLHLLT